MTSFSPPPERFTPDQVDELLSAELDSEFDAAAIAIGLTPSEAAARLEATPGVASRRAALRIAQQRFTVPQTALSDIAREQMVRAAVAQSFITPITRAGSTRRRSVQFLAPLGAVAAAVLVVVVVTRGSGPRHASNTAAVAAPSSVAGSPTPKAAKLRDQFGAQFGAQNRVPVDLGVIRNADELRAKLLATGGRAERFTTDSQRITVQPGASTTVHRAAGNPAPTTSAPANAVELDAASSIQCLARLPIRGGSSPPQIVATATFQGHAVVVAVSDDGRTTYVWAFRADSCALVLTAATT